MASSGESVFEAINKGETLLIIGLLGFGAYLLYNASQDFAGWINNLFGLQNASPENSYANAASQSVQHPLQTSSTILGGWWDDLFASPTLTLPSDLSSVGYTKIGASGTHYSCSGPQGAANDMCVPVSIDANGNMTQIGSAPWIHATDAN